MDELDKMLAQAREVSPPEALMGRVLQDALATQMVPAPRPLPRAGLWQRCHDLLGGWQGMGGLVATSCAGVWIGISPPAYLPEPALDLLQGGEALYSAPFGQTAFAFALEIDGEEN